jgi:hypothetical protein
MPAALPSGVKALQKLPDGRVVMELPRYFDFRIAATQLAQSGVNFVDIAGNQSVILVTAWAADGASLKIGHSRVLFEQALITMPGHKRVALVLPVAELAAFLSGAPGQGLMVEHVYDY